MSWVCQNGSSLLIPSGPSGAHLFTVALGPKVFEGYGPEEQVVLVSFTSIKQGLPHDNACEVASGEHPFITHNSYVFYREPRIYSASDVQSKIESKVWVQCDPCSSALIQKILIGFRKSKRLPRHYNEILDLFDL